MVQAMPWFDRARGDRAAWDVAGADRDRRPDAQARFRRRRFIDEAADRFGRTDGRKKVRAAFEAEEAKHFEGAAPRARVPRGDRGLGDVPRQFAGENDGAAESLQVRIWRARAISSGS